MDRRAALKALVSSLALCVFAPRASARGSGGRGTTYYIDPQTGDDTARGTAQRAAWRSLGKVNSRRFAPGDEILLRRGQTWTEHLRPQGSGTPQVPITIGAYGEGPRPVIDARGIAPALALVDQEGWLVQDLVLTSLGQTGLLLDSTMTKRSFFRLRNIEVYNSWFGMEIGRIKTGAGVNGGYLDDVLVDGCVVHDVGYKGIASAGNYGDLALPRNTNLTFSNCLVYNCGWDGVMMTSTSGGLITDCVAHDCGFAADARYGIWAWWADHVVIQKCEAYRIRTPGSKDGGGFDLDWGTSDCIIQYCYAHDNDGPGFAVIGNRQAPPNAPQRNVLRYNVSLGNCRKASAGAHGEITLFGGMGSIWAYNNTVYWSRQGRNSGALALSGWHRQQTDWPRNTVIRNTIIYVERGCRALRVDEEFTAGERANSLDYNLYHTTGPELPIQWGAKSYVSLATFTQETGQESHGLETDPRLRNPGVTQTGRLPLQSYQLELDSPCVDRGLRMQGHSAFDYWGNPVPTGKAPDIGAHELST